MAIVKTDDQNYINIANAIRAKTGSTDTFKPGEMDDAILQISGNNISFYPSEIPQYVKDEAANVAEKVKAVQTNKTITSICWADAHHCANQVSGWQNQTNIGTLHAAMGISAIVHLIDVDFCAYLGDYTFGNADTTLELFRQQCEQMNDYMSLSFSGFPSFFCVGNHDSGTYYERGGGELYGAQTIYNLIGGKNDDGITVMGSTTYGYCYRDLTDKKTRIICLNTTEGETDDGEDAGYCCSDAQLLWFAQTLYAVGANSDWNIIVLGHYPLDYGGNYKTANIVYEYVNGGSVTYNGTTVNFANHNAAKFVAQYHGHTHCFKVDKLHYIVNGSGTEFDAYRLATPSGIYYRNNDYAGHPLYGIDFGEETTYTKTANTADDTAFVVNVYDPEKEVIYSFCYGAGYDRLVSVGRTVYRQITQNLTHTETTNATVSVQDGDSFSTTIMPESGYNLQPITVTMGGVDVTSQVVTMNEGQAQYSVTNNLTNITNSNNAATVSGAYTATLTPTSGYEITNISITMGGVNIVSTVYNSGTINIPNVTGDVVITATATKIVNYTNQVPISTDASGAVLNGVGYAANTRLNSSGAEVGANGFIATGFIPFAAGDTIRLGGDGITFAEYGCMLYFYNSSKAARSGAGIDYAKVGNANFGTWLTESNTAFTFTPNQSTTYQSGYIRISAKGSGANLIVTINEEID